MILLQLAVWLIVAVVVAGTLSALDRGAARVPGAVLLGLALAWVPTSGVLWVGWGKLTNLNAHFGLGDSSSTSLPAGYRMIDMDGASGLLCGGPSDHQLVFGIAAIAETSTHFYGEARSRAFAIHKDLGTVRFDATIEGLGDPAFVRGALVPYYQFPGRSRNSVDTLVLFILFLGPPLAGGAWLRLRVGQSRSRLGQSQGHNGPPGEDSQR